MALVNATIHKALEKRMVDLGVPSEFEPADTRTKAQEKVSSLLFFYGFYSFVYLFVSGN